MLRTAQDWSPDDPAEIVTAAAGSGEQVKLWDINHPQSPKSSFDAGGDVMRVRYMPFGRGIATSAVIKVRSTAWPVFCEARGPRWLGRGSDAHLMN